MGLFHFTGEGRRKVDKGKIEHRRWEGFFIFFGGMRGNVELEE